LDPPTVPLACRAPQEPRSALGRIFLSCTGNSGCASKTKGRVTWRATAALQVEERGHHTRPAFSSQPLNVRPDAAPVCGFIGDDLIMQQPKQPNIRILVDFGGERLVLLGILDEEKAACFGWPLWPEGSVLFQPGSEEEVDDLVSDLTALGLVSQSQFMNAEGISAHAGIGGRERVDRPRARTRARHRPTRGGKL
jgi:hypothetical protein